MTTQTILPRATESFEAWYDAKDEDTQLLIDEINIAFVIGFLKFFIKLHFRWGHQ